MSWEGLCLIASDGWKSPEGEIIPNQPDRWIPNPQPVKLGETESWPLKRKTLKLTDTTTTSTDFPNIKMSCLRDYKIYKKLHHRPAPGMVFVRDENAYSFVAEATKLGRTWSHVKNPMSQKKWRYGKLYLAMKDTLSMYSLSMSNLGDDSNRLKRPKICRLLGDWQKKYQPYN